MAIGPVKRVDMVREARGDRRRVATSDDNAMMKQIQATHAPDGREVDVKPLIHVIEDIMHRATPPIPGLGLPPVSTSQAQLDALEDRTNQNGFTDMLEVLAYPINKISCEISCKCSGGSDAHTTTLAVFNALSSYSWEAKVVITFAAFAVNYGEFWLVAQLYPSNPLAKSVALFKQLTDMLERADSLKPKFEALINLIKAMLDVTKCIVQFKDLPPQDINPDTPEMLAATAYTPTAVYWTIRSIVACASETINFIGMEHKYMTVEELSSLGYKVNIIHNQLKNQLALCYKYLDKKGYFDPFHTLARLLATVNTDNTQILKALLCAKEDQLPLIDGYTKKRVHVDVLRRKNVLLLISNVDLSYEEHFFLHQLYIEAKQHPKENQYEVVWIPVMKETIPWDEVHQNKFKHIQASMLWFSVYQPSLLDPGVIKYINEVWNFNNKTMIVSIDPKGKVVNHNAICMCWIWGNHAFPFSSMREETLWEEMPWTIESLAGYINPSIVDWIASEKYICLYGGEDLDWIRSFTNAAKAVAKATQIPLELLYVGKSNPGRKVVKINNVIMVEKLSHTMPDLILIWHFWDRIESMWHSKKQHGKSVGNDPIMKEIKSILSFDKSDQGWAMISQGGTIEMAKAKGNTILKSLNQFEKWKDRVKEVDFLTAFNENLNELGSLDHCNTLFIPYAERSSSISEMHTCDDCGRLMEEFIVFC